MTAERRSPDELARQNTGQLLRLPYEAFIERVIGRLRAAGYGDLRPAHAIVLQHLRTEGSRATEMAERAQLTKQYMGALIADLEALGYVERFPDPADGRARLVRLSARGHEVTPIAKEISRGIEVDMTRLIGERRLRQLRRTLIDLIRAFDRDPEP